MRRAPSGALLLPLRRIGVAPRYATRSVSSRGVVVLFLAQRHRRMPALRTLVVEGVALAIGIVHLAFAARHRLCGTLLCGGLGRCAAGFSARGLAGGGHGGSSGGLAVGSRRFAPIVGMRPLSALHGRCKTFVRRRHGLTDGWYVNSRGHDMAGLKLSNTGENARKTANAALHPPALALAQFAGRLVNAAWRPDSRARRDSVARLQGAHRRMATCTQPCQQIP